MYFDLIFLIVVLVLVFFYLRNFSSFVYAFCIIDLFFKTMYLIRVFTMNSVPELSILIKRYIPESILSIFQKYTHGTLYVILAWIYIFIYIVFLFYTTRTFFNKKH